jgi:hypothetical protein
MSFGGAGVGGWGCYLPLLPFVCLLLSWACPPVTQVLFLGLCSSPLHTRTEEGIHSESLIICITNRADSLGLVSLLWMFSPFCLFCSSWAGKILNWIIKPGEKYEGPSLPAGLKENQRNPKWISGTGGICTATNICLQTEMIIQSLYHFTTDLSGEWLLA